jgi:hypothetical protein
MEEFKKQLHYAFATLLSATEQRSDVGNFKISNALGEVEVKGVEHQIQITLVPKGFHWIGEQNVLMSYEDL